MGTAELLRCGLLMICSLFPVALWLTGVDTHIHTRTHTSSGCILGPQVPMTPRKSPSISGSYLQVAAKSRLGCRQRLRVLFSYVEATVTLLLRAGHLETYLLEDQFHTATQWGGERVHFTISRPLFRHSVVFSDKDWPPVLANPEIINLSLCDAITSSVNYTSSCGSVVYVCPWT